MVRTRKKLSVTLIFLAAISCSGCGNREPMATPPLAPAKDFNARGLDFYHRGDLERAEEYFLRAVAASQAGDHLDIKAQAVYNLALVHLDRGEVDEAVSELRVAEGLFRRIEQPDGLSRALAARAAIRVRKGRHGEAKRIYEKALAEAPKRVAAEILTNLAIVHLKMNDLTTALQLSQQGVEQASNDLVLSDALYNRGRILIRAGTYESARHALERALVLDRDMGRYRSLAETLSLLGHLAARLGNDDESAEYHRRAKDVLEGLGLDRPD